MEEFIYSGEGRSRVPLYAVRVIVDISITAIPAGAFLYHTKLMDVELPALLCDIGRNSFGSCVQLKRIRIPTNVISIRPYAFAYCQKLVEVHLPAFLQAIEDYTFFKCHSLELIDIPSTITVIGSNAFFEARLLSIHLPDTLEEIESYAFFCNSLSTVRIPTGFGFGSSKSLSSPSSSDCDKIILSTTLPGMANDSIRARRRELITQKIDRIASLNTIQFVGGFRYHRCYRRQPLGENAAG